MPDQSKALNTEALSLYQMLVKQWRGLVHSIPATPANIGPEAYRLLQRGVSMPGRKILSLSITPGPGKPSFEEVCREINSAFDQERDGRATFDPPDSKTVPIDIREHLSRL